MTLQRSMKQEIEATVIVPRNIGYMTLFLQYKGGSDIPTKKVIGLLAYYLLMPGC